MGSRSINAMEQFPDVLPDPSCLSKRWVWKDELNALEHVLNGGNPVIERHPVGKNKAVTTSHGQQRLNQKPLLGPSVGMSFTKKLAHGSLPSSVKAAGKVGPSFVHGQSFGACANQKRLIELRDVKAVAYAVLSETMDISVPFQAMLRSQPFDEFLAMLLYYFEAYLVQKAAETRPKAMDMSQSRSEKIVFSSMCSQLDKAKRLVAEKYSSLLLGLGVEEQHHVACGKKRKSVTRKDRVMYETMFSFCCCAVWITFRREALDLIEVEMGRLFRSDAFNPCGRRFNGNRESDAGPMCEDLQDVKPATSLLRRIKRPAITAIVTQRSPILVALLPTSKDTGSWLLDRRKAQGLRVRTPESETSSMPLSEPSLEILKVGIIGEAMSAFNPSTLTPLGEDQDPDCDATDDDSSRRSYLGNHGDTVVLDSSRSDREVRCASSTEEAFSPVL